METLSLPFEHSHSAHCESGAISSLLRHQGLNISEPMAFGISGALTFAYIPILKIGGMPLIGYRMPPQHIIGALSKRLGYKLHKETFTDQQRGMKALDQHLANEQPVGLQTSVFWLPYFPKEMRFHFNAHNLVAYGKSEHEYLISDPTIEKPVTCDARALQKARFVKGMMKPKGLLYFPINVPETVALEQAIPKAIRSNCKMMLKTPVPAIGVSGIRMLAKRIGKFAKDSSSKQHANKLFIGHVVRMQEEIGTGGAGFRFLYASFLQEAAQQLQDQRLNTIAKQLTDAGDHWREFALHSAMMCKDRLELDYADLSQRLMDIADREKAVFTELSAI